MKSQELWSLSDLWDQDTFRHYTEELTPISQSKGPLIEITVCPFCTECLGGREQMSPAQ